MISNLKNFLQKHPKYCVILLILFAIGFIYAMRNKDIAWADWFSGCGTVSAVVYAVWQNKKQQEGFDKKMEGEDTRHKEAMETQGKIITQQSEQIKDESSYRRSVLIFDIIRKRGDAAIVNNIDDNEGLQILLLIITCRAKTITFLILMGELLPEGFEIHKDVDKILKAYLDNVLYSPRMQAILLPWDAPEYYTYYKILGGLYNNKLRPEQKEKYKKEKQIIRYFNKRFLGWPTEMHPEWENATT